MIFFSLFCTSTPRFCKHRFTLILTRCHLAGVTTVLQHLLLPSPIRTLPTLPASHTASRPFFLNCPSLPLPHPHGPFPLSNRVRQTPRSLLPHPNFLFPSSLIHLSMLNCLSTLFSSPSVIDLSSGFPHLSTLFFRTTTPPPHFLFSDFCHGSFPREISSRCLEDRSLPQYPLPCRALFLPSTFFHPHFTPPL